MEELESRSVAALVRGEDYDPSIKVPDGEIAENWIERNEARSYALLGDPAARLRVAEVV